jgi:tripartite-type tricarboxylate transporter receptor subunit TctC
MQDVIGGQIELAFDNAPLAWPQAQAGKVRALGVTTPRRVDYAPDLPAIAEQLPGFEATSWHGVFAPARTPRPIVDQLSGAIQALIRDPKTVARMREIGAIGVGSTPAEFAAHIAAETARWAPVIEKAGIKVE